MPRRYYRRTRVIRPKKKWASNIVTRNYTITPGSSGAGAVTWTTLVSNAVQSSAPTPVIVKAGNFKVNADFLLNVSGSSGGPYHLIAFVVFLPEGISPSNNQQFGTLITSHPEYIMAWRQLDTSAVSGQTTYNLDRVTFSSRLKRNLNSGDSIVFGILDQSTELVSTTRVQLTCQYWTCSN